MDVESKSEVFTQLPCKFVNKPLFPNIFCVLLVDAVSNNKVVEVFVKLSIVDVVSDIDSVTDSEFFFSLTQLEQHQKININKIICRIFIYVSF